MSVSIVQTVHEARQTYGLRHSDYDRYHSFCTSKIHRVRKACKLTQGKKTFQSVPVAFEASDPKPLLILVFQAERAWCAAMQAKGKDRAVVLQKLRRAVHYATALRNLVLQTENVPESLLHETEAFCAMKKSYLLMERKLYSEAISELTNARNAYEQLSVDPVIEKLCLNAIEQTKPLISFCRFNVSGGDEDMEELVNVKKMGQELGSGFVVNQLDVPLLLTPQSLIKAKTGTKHVSWRHHTLEISDSSVYECYLLFKGHQSQVKSAQDKAKAYEQLIGSLWECIEKSKTLDKNVQLFFHYQKDVATIDRSTFAFTQDPLVLVKSMDANIRLLTETRNAFSDLFEQDQYLLHLYELFVLLENIKKRLVVLKYKKSTFLMNKVLSDLEEAKDLEAVLVEMDEKLKKRRLEGDLSYIGRVDALDKQASKTRVLMSIGTLIPSNERKALFPVGMVPLPFKPMFFDIASNHVEYPFSNVERRIAGKQRVSVFESSEDSDESQKKSPVSNAGLMGWLGWGK